MIRAEQAPWTRSGVLLFIFGAWAACAPAQTGFPFTDETLHYAVNWPSGVSLGEAHMTASHDKTLKQWNFELTLDASVPSFAVSDKYTAASGEDLCSLSFEKKIAHGARKSHEKIAIDQHAMVATRETIGGGKSDLSVSSCARDALTFLYFARRELGQGRVAPHERILYGSAYQIRLEYTGAQSIKVNNKKYEADRLVAVLKGPASETTFEMFFARDPARTPLMIRVPLSLGMFSMELSR
jgi:hypothetical protein